MLWSDHEIRDGWGSWASDSPTLQAKYPERRCDCGQVQRVFRRRAQGVLALSDVPQLPDADCRTIHARRAHDDPRAVQVRTPCGAHARRSRRPRSLARNEPACSAMLSGTSSTTIFCRSFRTTSMRSSSLRKGPSSACRPNGEAVRRFGHREDDVELFSRGRRPRAAGAADQEQQQGRIRRSPCRSP